MNIADLPAVTVGGRESGADVRVRNELVMDEENQRLVAWARRHYRSAGMPAEDVEQDAQVGLLRAAQAYEPVDGATFRAHAIHYVRNEVRGDIAAMSRPVKLTRNQRVALGAFLRARDALAGDSGRVPGDDEVMDAMGLSGPAEREKVAAILRVDRAFTVAIPEVIPAPDGGEAPSSRQRDLRDWLHSALADLDEAGRYVIKHRYGVSAGLPRPVPVKMLAFRLGVDVARVEEIEREALAALREAHARRKGA